MTQDGKMSHLPVTVGWERKGKTNEKSGKEIFRVFFIGVLLNNSSSYHGG